MIGSTILSISPLNGGDFSASCFGRFTPSGKASSTHWIGVGLDLVAVRENLALPGIEPRPSDQQPVILPTEYLYSLVYEA